MSVMILVCALMLIPFYWVAKTAVTNENIYAYPPRILPLDPHLYNFVDVWYLIPFARYFANSVIVSLIAVAGNILFNAAAGYALTKNFPGKRAVVLLFLSCMLIPFQATIIPAYLVSARLGVLNSYLGLALPLLSTIVCIFVFKAAFEAMPASLQQAARIDGLGELRIMLRIMLPLAKPAIATNVILSFIWSWNAFLWPLIITRDVDHADLAARPRALPRLCRGHDGRALRLRVHGAFAGHRGVPDGAEGVHSRPDLGSDQGMNWRAILTSRFFVVPAVALAALIGWNLYVAAHAHGRVSGKVLRADGAPAAGATVVLYERNITSHFLEKARTTTDAAGEFRFDDNRSHQIRLDAIGPDGRPDAAAHPAPLVRRARCALARAAGAAGAARDRSNARSDLKDKSKMMMQFGRKTNRLLYNFKLMTCLDRGHAYVLSDAVTTRPLVQLASVS